MSSSLHQARQIPHRSALSNRSSNNHHSSQSNRRSRITGNSASNSESAIDVLRKLIQTRWDPVTKLLDLANLAQDKILKAAGISPPGQKGAPVKTAGAIWKLCQEICPDVRSISLADNHLQTLQPMSMSILVATFPELANLSLARNRLSSFTELNSLSPTTGGVPIDTQTPKQGFVQLRELILTGNPLRSKAEKDGPMGLQSYLFEVYRRFPSLEVLDGEAIDPNVKANLFKITHQSTSLVFNHHPLPTNRSLNTPNSPIPHIQPPLPMSIQSAFFDDPSTSTFAAAFCLKYFTAFDSDRACLMDVYATKSSFSLCASPFIPSRAKLAGLTRNTTDMPAQQVPSWNEYITMSRNHAKLKGPKLSERIANGPAEIIQSINSIPRTKHPLETAEKFVVDSWQINGLVNEAITSGNNNGTVIFLSIHGQFQEFPSLTVRSFDRTFVLGAAGPASAAAMKGWPCVILTDQLTVRGYCSPLAWSTTTTINSSTHPNPVHVPSAILPPNLTTNLGAGKNESITLEQNELVKRLMDLTKLNPTFAIDCLTQNHWDLDLSIKNFHELMSRGGLPSQAFLS